MEELSLWKNIKKKKKWIGLNKILENLQKW